MLLDDPDEDDEEEPPLDAPLPVDGLDVPLDELLEEVLPDDVLPDEDVDPLDAELLDDEDVAPSEVEVSAVSLFASVSALVSFVSVSCFVSVFSLVFVFSVSDDTAFSVSFVSETTFLVSEDSSALPEKCQAANPPPDAIAIASTAINILFFFILASFRHAF